MRRSISYLKMVSILIDEGRCDVKLKRLLCMVLVCLLSMGVFCVPVKACLGGRNEKVFF